MAQFTSCYGFVGNKIIYGITIVRQLILELLAATLGNIECLLVLS